MNPELNSQDVEVEQKPSALNSVTPLSKYLAMILFIMMPFVGGWIGYSYTPVKIVEVEKIIYQEVNSEPGEKNVASSESVSRESELYFNPSGKFSFYYPGNWLLREDLTNNEWVSVTPMNPLPNATEVPDFSISIQSFKDFYLSAVEHGYLDSNYDGQDKCQPIDISGKNSVKCISAVVEGVIYIVPLSSNSEYKEALFIIDVVNNESSLKIINSLKS